MINPLEEACFRLCRRGIPNHAETHPTYESVGDYGAWRDSRLENLFTTYFDVLDIRDRRVVDFGCGLGNLTRFTVQQGATSATGIDLDEKFVVLAREAAACHGLEDRVSFMVGRPDAVPMGQASTDVILCFDVLEHVLNYQAIVSEWHRILVREGKVLIWWIPWMHPYGHHLYPLINVPWAHLVLSDAALLRVCAKLYDAPGYRPSFWHLTETGQKKANPYAGDDTLEDFLNKLTTWEFESACQRAGLRVARKDVVPFSGNRAKTLKKVLASIPFLSDAFAGCVVYELRRI